MKDMLSHDLIRVLIMVVMSLLCAVYAIYIDHDLELVCKSFLFLIPILTFLENTRYLKEYGIKKVLEKEGIVLGITLTVYLIISIITCKIFYDKFFKLDYIRELFILFTVFLVMNNMIFIKSNLKRASFAFLMIAITILILVLSYVSNLGFVIYILYVLLDIILIVELIIFARRYENDIYLKD